MRMLYNSWRIKFRRHMCLLVFFTIIFCSDPYLGRSASTSKTGSSSPEQVVRNRAPITFLPVQDVFHRGSNRINPHELDPHELGDCSTHGRSYGSPCLAKSYIGPGAPELEELKENNERGYLVVEEVGQEEVGRGEEEASEEESGTEVRQQHEEEESREREGRQREEEEEEEREEKQETQREEEQSRREVEQEEEEREEEEREQRQREKERRREREQEEEEESSEDQGEEEEAREEEEREEEEERQREKEEEREEQQRRREEEEEEEEAAREEERKREEKQRQREEEEEREEEEAAREEERKREEEQRQREEEEAREQEEAAREEERRREEEQTQKEEEERQAREEERRREEEQRQKEEEERQAREEERRRQEEQRQKEEEERKREEERRQREREREREKEEAAREEEKRIREEERREEEAAREKQRQKEEEEREEQEAAREEKEQREKKREQEEEEEAALQFVLGDPIEVIKTDAGKFGVLPRVRIGSELGTKKIGLGFLDMEPNAILLDHYLDANCLLLVYKGMGRLSWVDGADLHNINLEEGDIYKLESGTVFHIYNFDEEEQLRIFSIFDTVSLLNGGMLHTFFVAGGEKPRTVLSGFNVDMLATAFNASQEAVTDLLSSQTGGAIMYASKRNESTSVSGFRGSIMGILGKYIGLPNIFPRDARGKPFNIFKKAADFSNDYGSTTAVHEGEFRPLKDINKGVFSVSLKAGALLAPHWNPTATEIALVTEGEGEIHVVYPNGSAAVTEQVGVGDVFVVPQNFPMCQIAARSGVFKFVGFSTSSRPNHPQFIAGLNSVLKALDTDVLAVAYNIPVKHIQDFLNLQPESVILPGKLEQTIFLSSMSEVASTKRKGRSSFFA